MADKISNILALPNFAKGLSGKQKQSISAGVPINTQTILNDMLKTSPDTNRNIKKISPDGAIELFDDNLTGSPSTAGMSTVNPAPLREPTSAVANQALERTPRTDLNAPGVLPEESGGIGEFVTSPGFRRLLSQLGLALSASAPNSFANQIAQFANQNIEGQIFQSMLSELLGGQQEGPNLPTQGGLATLSPQLQLSALQSAQAIKAGARQSKSADIRDFANLALAVDRLTPKEKAARVFDKSIKLKTFKGKTAPPNRVWVVGQNENGQFNNVIGTAIERETFGDTDKKKRITPSELETLQENIILAFNDEIKEGIAKVFGVDIASSGDLLQFLRSGEFEQPLDRAQRALAAVPEALLRFNDEIEKAVIRVQGGAELSTAINEITGSIIESKKVTKGTLPGIRTSAEAK